MDEISALAAMPAVEGAFVFGAYNIAATLNGGPQGSPRAGLGGVAVGRFGWMADNGRVLNARTASTDQLGIVLPQAGPQIDWRVIYWDAETCTLRVREGFPLPMLTRGNVWARFSGGSFPGDPVYANTLDGSAISGYSPAGELTPWTVAQPCGPGGLAVITTWSKPV